MGKTKKKQDPGSAPAPIAPPGAAAEGELPDRQPTTAGQEPPLVPLPPPGRLRRWLPDLIKAALALGVISIGAAIWYQPPLTLADFPYVSYHFQGQTFTDAQLFRPLAMPTRYYIRLPKKLAARYEWFAVDRRREVAALTLAPDHRFLGRDAIKRSDPLGLDLEFRKLDHSEWQVHFLADAIVFSNAVLTVRMDARRTANDTR